MNKPKSKIVNFMLDRGIRMNGISIRPKTKEGKPTVIPIRESLARELASASKGKIVDAKIKPNFKIPERENDGLDAAFGTDKSE